MPLGTEQCLILLSTTQSWCLLYLYSPTLLYILLVQAITHSYTEVLAFLWEKHGLISWPNMRKGNKYFITHKIISLLLSQNRGFPFCHGDGIKSTYISHLDIMIFMLNALTQTDLKHNLIEVDEKVCHFEAWRRDTQ